MNSKITVLFVTHYAGMYGANQSMCQLMVELKDKYDVIPVVLIPQEGKICEFLKENHIEYIVYRFFWWVNADHGLFKLLLNVRKQIRNYRRLSELSEILSGRHIDIVYTNSIVVNTGYFLSQRLNVPHIWHLRETLAAYGFKFSLGPFISKMILKKGADQYIAISEYVANAYATYIPKSKMLTIHNGVSYKTDESRIANAIRQDVLNICCIGVICEQKNQLDIVKAIDILNRRGITGIKVYFVGDAKSEYLRLLWEFVELNSLQNKVEFYGFRSDLNYFLNSMNIGVMSSRDEGFGRVNIEYMLHRMPVIASKAGANSELIYEGINGLMYTLYCPEELADKIKYFIDNPLALEAFGSNGYAIAVQKFSLEVNTREIYRVFERYSTTVSNNTILIN